MHLNKIILFGIENDPDTENAETELLRLNGAGFAKVMCPPLVRELYVVPFVEDEIGEAYYGLSSIKSFVNARMS